MWCNRLKRIEKKLDQLILTEGKLVAAIDDLKTAVQAMATVDAAETDAINKAVAVITNPGSSDADVEAAAQAILASNQSRSDATAKLVAALPAPR